MTDQNKDDIYHLKLIEDFCPVFDMMFISPALWEKLSEEQKKSGKFIVNQVIKI